MTTTLFLLLIPILALILYSKPTLVNINPFFTTSSSSPEPGYEEIKRADIIPQVKAQTPQGWSIKTTNKKIEKSPYVEDIIVTGLVDILVYKEKELVGGIYSVGDTGGMGALFYKFPNYDPEIYANVENMDDDIKTVVDVEEGDYTEIEVLGNRIRRVENRYIQNDSENPEEYFGNIGSIFLFSFDSPLFEYCYDYQAESQEESNLICMDHYVIRIEDDLEEEDLLILDSILESMEVR
jgi:hypothetical protein